MITTTSRNIGRKEIFGARPSPKTAGDNHWMEPMLATLTHEHFSNPDWIFERKLDGERIGFGALLLGYYEENKLRYAGKVGTDCTSRAILDCGMINRQKR